MFTRQRISIVVVGLAFAQAALAADLNAGKKIAETVCTACHGVDGNSPSPDFPRIGGQHRDYLQNTLEAYKSGKRKNPIMAGFVGALSKSDIENVAAWYGKQKGPLLSKY